MSFCLLGKLRVSRRRENLIYYIHSRLKGEILRHMASGWQGGVVMSFCLLGKLRVSRRRDNLIVKPHLLRFKARSFGLWPQDDRVVWWCHSAHRARCA